MVEVMKIMGPPSKGPRHALPHSVPPTLHLATADPRLRQRLVDTHRQVWVSLLRGYCSFLLGPGAQGSVCALLESVSPVLCKFWGLCGGVNGDLLQEGLWHTQVCCTQSPCPCSGQTTADLYLHRRRSDTVLAQSLWGLRVLVHTRYVRAL